MAGRKNVLFPFHLTTDASMGASVTSASVNVQWLDNIYFTVNFTGTPTGTFAVQGSGDGGVNWQNIRLLTNPVASGAPDTVGIEINQAPMPLIRVVYTRVSGTGNMNIYVTAKEL
jgi:hypothetical protein